MTEYIYELGKAEPIAVMYSGGSLTDWASSGSLLPIGGIPKMEKNGKTKVKCWYCGGANYVEELKCVHCGAPLLEE